MFFYTSEIQKVHEDMNINLFEVLFDNDPVYKVVVGTKLTKVYYYDGQRFHLIERMGGKDVTLTTQNTLPAYFLRWDCYLDFQDAGTRRTYFDLYIKKRINDILGITLKFIGRF